MIERAKELLEQKALPTQRVAELVGMGSVESLRHHFRILVGTTPAAYGARFNQRGERGYTHGAKAETLC
jgi:AraC family transcriptional activator FtrA